MGSGAAEVHRQLTATGGEAAFHARDLARARSGIDAQRPGEGSVALEDAAAGRSEQETAVGADGVAADGTRHQGCRRR